METLFEKMGGTYREVGDNILLNFIVSKQSKRPIGVWGEYIRRYVKEHYKVIYYNYLKAGTLCEYLTNANEKADDLYFRLVKSPAEKENVNE